MKSNRGRSATAAMLLVAAIGCAGDGVIDLLPEAAEAGPGSSASATCPAPPLPRPEPPMPAPMPNMMPAAMPGMTMPAVKACEGGPCPAAATACDLDAASLVDSEAVTP